MALGIIAVVKKSMSFRFRTQLHKQIKSMFRFRTQLHNHSLNTPCSRQYSSQHALPIWQPAWPMWMEMTSRMAAKGGRKESCVERGFGCSVSGGTMRVQTTRGGDFVPVCVCVYVRRPRACWACPARLSRSLDAAFPAFFYELEKTGTYRYISNIQGRPPT